MFVLVEHTDTQFEIKCSTDCPHSALTAGAINESKLLFLLMDCCFDSIRYVTLPILSDNGLKPQPHIDDLFKMFYQ